MIQWKWEEVNAQWQMETDYATAYLIELGPQSYEIEFAYRGSDRDTVPSYMDLVRSKEWAEQVLANMEAQYRWPLGWGRIEGGGNDPLRYVNWVDDATRLEVVLEDSPFASHRRWLWAVYAGEVVRTAGIIALQGAVGDPDPRIDLWTARDKAMAQAVRLGDGAAERCPECETLWPVGVAKCPNTDCACYDDTIARKPNTRALPEWYARPKIGESGKMTEAVSALVGTWTGDHRCEVILPNGMRCVGEHGHPHRCGETVPWATYRCQSCHEKRPSGLIVPTLTEFDEPFRNYLDPPALEPCGSCAATALLIDLSWDVVMDPWTEEDPCAPDLRDAIYLTAWRENIQRDEDAGRLSHVTAFRLRMLLAALDAHDLPFGEYDTQYRCPRMSWSRGEGKQGRAMAIYPEILMLTHCESFPGLGSKLPMLHPRDWIGTVVSLVRGMV